MDSFERARYFKKIGNAKPALKDYYKSLLANYNALKDSSDPVLCSYWWAALQRAQAAGNKKCIEKTTQRLDDLMDGVQTAIRVDNKNAHYLDVNHFKFRIRRGQIDFKPDSPVHVQGFLSTGPDPNRYASDALPEDPAFRFSIKVAGFDGTNQPVDCFLNVRGETTVKDINTLVDRIEGGTLAYIANKPRRLVPRIENRDENFDLRRSLNCSAWTGDERE